MDQAYHDYKKAAETGRRYILFGEYQQSKTGVWVRALDSASPLFWHWKSWARVHACLLRSFHLFTIFFSVVCLFCSLMFCLFGGGTINDGDLFVFHCMQER